MGGCVFRVLSVAAATAAGVIALSAGAAAAGSALEPNVGGAKVAREAGVQTRLAAWPSSRDACQVGLATSSGPGVSPRVCGAPGSALSTVAITVEGSFVDARHRSLAGSSAARRTMGDRYATALNNAISFMSATVADHGGYMYNWTRGDQKYILGENSATGQQCLALMHVYQATGLASALDAAKQTAAFAEATQNGVTGGWFSEMYTHATPPAKQSGFIFFYRTDEKAGQTAGTRYNFTHYNDNRTLSLLKCLMRLDQAEKRTDPQLEKVTNYGLNALLAGAYPSGGYPEWYFDCHPTSHGVPLRCSAAFPAVSASITNPPENTYPYPINTYSNTQERAQLYSLSHATGNNIMDTLFEAWRWSGAVKYKTAAVKLADWMLRAQLPDPQPGWAELYNNDMNPDWGNPYEPPAISSSATFYTIRSLISAYRVTGDVRYKNAAVKGFNYINPHRQGYIWPNYLQFGTDRPLYISNGTHGTVPANTVTTDPAFAPDYNLTGIGEDFSLVGSEIASIGQETCALPTATSSTGTQAQGRADGVIAAVEAMPKAPSVYTATAADNFLRLAQWISYRDQKDTWVNPESVAYLTSVRESPCVYITTRAYMPPIPLKLQARSRNVRHQSSSESSA